MFPANMDLHDVSGTSTGQTLPRERRAPPGTHFCPTIGGVYPPSAIIFILNPLLCTFSSTFVRNIPTFDHSSTLKRRPQTSVTAADLVWVCAPPRTIHKWLRRLAFGSCGPGRKILAAAAADLVWVCAPPRTIRKWLLRLAFWILRSRAQDPCSCCCRPGGSAPRRGPFANGCDALRFGSCGPARKILAAAAADLVWVFAPPRTIRKWLRRLAFWILRTRAQDPCSCCLIFRTKVDEKVDNSGCVWVFSSHPFWTSSSLDVPAGVTQEEGHTGFLIHLPSAVRALVFVARRIQPFLSLVDREVEFCVLTN